MAKHSGFSVHPPALSSMSTKLGGTSSSLSGHANTVGSAHPGSGAFGVVGQALGGHLGGTLSTMQQHIGSVATAAQGAGDKLRGTVADLHANETHNAGLFNNIHNPGKAPSVHSTRSAPGGTGQPPGGGGRRPGWTDANGIYHTGSGRPVRPPTQHEPYAAPPAWANPQAGPTSQELTDLGRYWHANAWLQQMDRPGAAGLINNLPEATQQGIAGHGFSLRPGPWQTYEPVVYHNGRPSSYNQFVNHVTNQPDGGAGAAGQLHQWSTGQLTFNQLPPHLQDMAMITHFAETGRGYTAPVADFDHNMGRIAGMNPQDARAHWQNINQWFPPSMTYGQDNAAGGAYHPPASP